MPRQPRHLLGDGAYHVIVRGTARCVIFRDEIDLDAFMRLLSRTIKRFGWKCHALCLMPNHFHLVIEAECEALSRGMHWMTGIYAQRFNTRHDRVGHLVQNRFTARLIEGEDALERVSAYVLENPVKAELCERPEDWRWVGLGQPRA